MMHMICQLVAYSIEYIKPILYCRNAMYWVFEIDKSGCWVPSYLKRPSKMENKSFYTFLYKDQLCKTDTEYFKSEYIFPLKYPNNKISSYAFPIGKRKHCNRNIKLCIPNKQAQTL